MAVITYFFFLSLKVAFIDIDWPFISVQSVILSRSIIAIRSYTLLFKIDFLAPFSSLQVKYLLCVIFDRCWKQS